MWCCCSGCCLLSVAIPVRATIAAIGPAIATVSSIGATIASIGAAITVSVRSLSLRSSLSLPLAVVATSVATISSIGASVGATIADSVAVAVAGLCLSIRGGSSGGCQGKNK